MRSLCGRQRRQRGAALILFLTILIVGVAWYAVGALGKAPVATAEREVITGRALLAAKQALLSYAAQYAARSTTADPGQMPCPESPTLANPGEASTSCSPTAIVVGRLPWKTLGIDPLRDGAGEPLWYIMRGFRDPPINFGTAGQLTYDGNTVVAMIIAPGVPLNTTGTPPAGCTAQNQMVATRNAATLNPANFIECGVSTGGIASPGDSAWTNDRVIAVTAAEWADAIAPAIADRLQRQVAPTLEEWRTTQSPANWGTSFLPYASSFGTPTANDYCGDLNQREGLLPVASATGGTCSTAWTGGTVTQLLGLLSGTCSSGATEITCTIIALAPILLSARVTATAPGVASSFRAKIGATSPDVTVSPSGSISNFSLTLDPSSGNATVSFDVSDSGLVTPLDVRIKNLPDAPILSDSRITWFLNNNWHQHTYYAVSEAATANPTGTCAASGDPQCLELNAIRDKRLMLALMGPRAVNAQTQPSVLPADYLESHVSGTTVFASATVTSTFNDRLAACPLKYQDHAGADVVICN